MRTVVLQSHHEDRRQGWIQTCMNSVQDWASQNAYDYRVVDDEIFNVLPPWYRDKFAERGPILSDLARLLWIQRYLLPDYDRAVWADADFLVFDSTSLSLPTISDAGFGVETWVDHDANQRLRTWRNVHNALMVFQRDSVVLPYLILSIESIASRIERDRVAPQTFGPRLLSALHNISGFDLIGQAGAFSPGVLADIASGGGPFLNRLHRDQDVVPAAANLCASLVTDPSQMQTVCDRLLAGGLPLATQAR